MKKCYKKNNSKWKSLSKSRNIIHQKWHPDPLKSRSLRSVKREIQNARKNKKKSNYNKNSTNINKQMKMKNYIINNNNSISTSMGKKWMNINKKISLINSLHYSRQKFRSSFSWRMRECWFCMKI